GPTRVDVGGGEKLYAFGEYVLVEHQHVVGDVEDLVEDRPAGADGVLSDLVELGVGVDRRLGVAGHVDLGHHGDVSCARVGDDLADVVLGEETTVGAAVEDQG